MTKNYLVLILLSFVLFSFVPNEACMQILMGYIKEMSVIDAPKKGRVYYMQMGMALTYKTEASKNSNVTSDIYLTNTELVYQNSQLSIFQDSIDAFMISHGNRQIIWAKGSKNLKDEATRSQLSQIQSAAIEGGKINRCQESTYKGRKVKIIEIEPREEVQNKLKVSHLIFYYELKEDRLFEVQIKYLPGHTIREQIVTYNKMDFNYKGWKPQSARSRVLSSNGVLLPKYRNYTLINSK